MGLTRDYGRQIPMIARDYKFSQIICSRSLCRTRYFATILFVIIYSVDVTFAVPNTGLSNIPSARHRKSADVETFECSDANTYLYHVLAQSKTARSLSSDPATVDSSSSRHHPAIPKQAISGDHLKVCSQGFTCCTEEMESRLLGESKREFQKFVQDKIVGLSHTFESRTSKFDRFFRELISNAKRDLHNMFLRTYGLLYEQNSDIFAALFDNLTHYYGNGPSTPVTGGNSQTIATSTSSSSTKVNLSRAIDFFYNTLYQRMFRILNQPYDFEPRYWQCMSGQMERLKPFGDVPANMKQQVQKAFIAARTFVQGLAAGRDVVRRMMELSPSSECTSGLMRLLYCPHCRGFSNVKPCSNFCINVMKGCLSYQADFDHGWNEYLDALLQLLNRLEGPFNIETVIDPIDVKISEAIMIFQDRGKEISDQIFSECGPPKMGPGRRNRRVRLKRESDRSESRPSSNRRRQNQGRGKTRARQRQKQERQFNAFLSGGSSPQPNQNQPISVRPTTAAGTSLDRLARDLREKVHPAKGFWRHLPHTLCNDDKISPATAAVDYRVETDCWNGLAKDRYAAPIVGDGPLSHLSNPEVPLDSGRSSNSSVRDLLSKLRTATAAMKKAYHGQEPEWRYSAAVNPDALASTPSRPAPAPAAKPNRNRPIAPTTPNSARPKAESIAPPLPRDGSGDPFDDTEVFKPRPGVSTPRETDDEELVDGSGSGEGEVPELPPSRLAPTQKAPSGIDAGGRSTKSPTKKPSQFVGGRTEEDSTESIDLGGDSGGTKSTAATWTSSEEANTFEPVTTTVEPDDESEEYEYDPLDTESGWKVDDDGATNSTEASTTARLDIDPSTRASTSTSTEPSTMVPVVNTQPTEAPRRPALTTPNTPVMPSSKKLATTKKPPPKPGSGSTAIGLSSCTFYFLLAFYSALTLLWKRLCA